MGTGIRVYLIAYFVLLAGAGLALWQAGVFGRLPVLWVLAVAAVAVGLGILLALTSMHDNPVRE